MTSTQKPNEPGEYEQTGVSRYDDKRDPDLATILLVAFTGLTAVGSVTSGLVGALGQSKRRRRANLEKIAKWGEQIKAVRDHIRMVRDFLHEVLPRPQLSTEKPLIGVGLRLSDVDLRRYMTLVAEGLKHVRAANSARTSLITALTEEGEGWSEVAGKRLGAMAELIMHVKRMHLATIVEVWGGEALGRMFEAMEEDLDRLIDFQAKLREFVAA